MLEALRIHNFVLIESLELRLEPGFNVLTGETGAGKSIVVGALAMVLGGRARTDLVRPGAAEAEVEALFDVSACPALCERLAASGIGGDGELVIRRVVPAQGRARAYLNGRLCTAGELAALAPDLADITSQHESVALTDPSRHLAYLDRYGALVAAREELAQLVDELHHITGELAALRQREQSRAEREGFLRYQLGRMRELAPRAGEMAELTTELAQLRHAERLRSATLRAARRLDDDDSLCDELGKLAAELAAAAEIDATLAPLAAELEDCWSRLRSVARQAARYAERIEADPDRLEQVNERIYELEGLMRQHGPTLDHVLSAQQRIEDELAELDGAHSRIPALESRMREVLQRAGALAGRLSKRRRAAARQLGAAISAELGDLGMGKARVVVEVTPSSGPGDLTVGGARLGRDGIDRVQFLIAPNRGLEPRPLSRIASGGELSRALLALKRALMHPGDEPGVGIQVFDEVDAGVGGATADAIGRAIAAIAAARQVLCITHLAAIAAHARAHFVVEKRDGRSATATVIRRVEQRARVAELARMLTGSAASPASLRAAAELLAAATTPAAA